MVLNGGKLLRVLRSLSFILLSCYGLYIHIKQCTEQISNNFQHNFKNLNVLIHLDQQLVSLETIITRLFFFNSLF